MLSRELRYIMSDLVLSEDQRRALDLVRDWLRRGTPGRFVLAGHAGTGKTTLVKQILTFAPERTAVCALSGKAAHVLRGKGISRAQTYHSLIYNPVETCRSCGELNAICLHVKSGLREMGRPNDGCRRNKGIKTDFVRRSFLDRDLLIVDEASMVEGQHKQDLESFGIPVLYVGDHGQLEPVRDDPQIMRVADVRLEHIHRQAANSPIIQFAHHLRQRKIPGSFSDGGDAVELIQHQPARMSAYDIVLTGFHSVRAGVNQKIRRELGFSGRFPQVGETIICLTNNQDHGLFNGIQAKVLESSIVEITRKKEGKKIKVEAPKLTIEDEDGVVSAGLVCEPDQFFLSRPIEDRRVSLPHFDFGYAINVHKAQGSEWDHVLVLEDLHPTWAAHRWRYTAATRAAKRLTYKCQPESVESQSVAKRKNDLVNFSSEDLFAELRRRGEID